MKFYTATEATEQYPIRMKRGQVVELGRKVGLTEWTVRTMLDGQQIRPIIYPGMTRAYYDRQEVIRTLFNKPAVTAMAS